MSCSSLQLGSVAQRGCALLTQISVHSALLWFEVRLKQIQEGTWLLQIEHSQFKSCPVNALSKCDWKQYKTSQILSPGAKVLLKVFRDGECKPGKKYSSLSPFLLILFCEMLGFFLDKTSFKMIKSLRQRNNMQISSSKGSCQPYFFSSIDSFCVLTYQLCIILLQVFLRQAAYFQVTESLYRLQAIQCVQYFLNLFALVRL